MSVQPHLAERPRAVAIGASAGAVQALLKVLPALPPTFPLPVLIVVHVPPDRANALVALFETRCQIRVCEAQDKELPEAGTVYFAPSDYHLLVEADGSLALSLDDPVNFSRPSIDLLLETAADAFGAGLVGIILTGANHDGAAGLKAVGEAGGLTLVEDPQTASSPVMPAAALAEWPAARRLDLGAITSLLINLAV